MKVLVVIDMQTDFVDGALGTPEAVAILPKVVEKIKAFDGLVLATRDTHGPDYLHTAEGKKLPIAHCIRGTAGWELHPQVAPLIETAALDKPTFGSVALAHKLAALHEQTPLHSIELVGLCTDICVISNALLLKATMPEVPILVDAVCCAGVSPATHNQALAAMTVCQIDIVNGPCAS